MKLAVIGLGGNTSGTLNALSDARSYLTGLLTEARASSLYRSSPQLDEDQEWFWNAVVCGQWSGTAEGLLERLLMWEAGAGREREPERPKGPRLIDLDLLLLGDLSVDTARLRLPHPGLVHRRFALEPLLELLPEVLDPMGLPWSQHLPNVLDQGVDRTDRTW